MPHSSFRLLLPLTAFALFCCTLTAHSQLELRGELTQGGLIIGTTQPGTSVTLDDKALHVATNGVFVFGFGRDAAAQAQLTLTYPDQSQEHRQLAIQPRQFTTQRIDGVPQHTVNPAPEALQRIRSETRLVKIARQRNEAHQAFLNGFVWPLHGTITGVYGSQRIYNGVPKRPHYGIDIAAPSGAIVQAPAAGLITLVHKDMYYSGGTMILDHGLGISSTFLHLKRALVQEGQHVQQGDPIAEVGSSGRSTGAHLDWRINWFNTRLDPQLVAPPMPTIAR